MRRSRSSIPDAKLPAQPIAVVHRSDGSGTTFNFDRLSFEGQPGLEDRKVGANTSVEWPVGIGAKGNEGVANNVAQTKGAIGYVEYRLRQAEQDDHRNMMNKEGKRLSADAAPPFQAAAANADWQSVPGFWLDPRQSAGRRLVAD